MFSDLPADAVLTDASRVEPLDGAIGTRKNCRISLIVPALNEEAVIEANVEAFINVTGRSFVGYEVILVNDGSTDRTGEIMDRVAQRHDHVRVIHNAENMGLGRSYVRGVEAARYEYVMMLCGDGGLPADSLPPIFEAVGSADIVIPYMTNLKAIKTPIRYILSRGYTNIINLLFKQSLHYYNGLPVHRRNLLSRVKIASGGFGFQGEILVKLLKAKCSYVEVGVKGAELTQTSSALRPRNLLSIGKTLANLIWEVATFKPEKFHAPVEPDDKAVDESR